MSNLAKRFITGFIGGGLMVAAILWNEYSFSALFLFITVMSMWEFYTWCEKNAIQPQKLFGMLIGSMVFIFLSFFMKFLPAGLDLLLLPLLFCIFIRELFRETEKPFINIAITVLCVIYLALPLALMNLISQYSVLDTSGSYHSRVVLGYLFIVWASDTGAYFFGVKFGKRKLFERISPKKTWEGTIGGTFFALLIAYIISLYFTDLNLTDWIFITIIVAVTGTLGDLVESMFKRSIHIKDSGSVLPGHGGFLDRFDAFFISAPFVLTYLKLSHS